MTDEGYTTILLDISNGVAVITLNRPESLNAFNEVMKAELLDALKSVEKSDAARAVVITGAGRGFGSGQDLADLKYMYGDGGAPDLGAMLRKGYNPLIRRMHDLPMPIIAAVNGVAAGAGCSLALACDLRIASAKASFVEAFVHVGLIPDCGGTFYLPRIVGSARAMELCMLGDKIRADEALEIGLVNRVVEPESLMDSAMELAGRLAASPTRAIGLTKRLINRSFGNDLPAQLEAEAYAQATAAGSEDHVEGVRAFLDKRKPEFKGR
ncbi:MAG: enoyl-CoA hydratase-related protein [Planctomycetota bacterium]|jgi:2-(1,2-epoxy-1,2-dihydrophenyl)acetyl-CoA isomerase